jgi:hypothetical protein
MLLVAARVEDVYNFILFVSSYMHPDPDRGSSLRKQGGFKEKT